MAALRAVAAGVLLIALTVASGGCARKATTGLTADEDFCSAAVRPGDGYPAAVSPVEGLACGSFASPTLWHEGAVAWMGYSCGSTIRLASSTDGTRWADRGAAAFASVPRWAQLAIVSPSVLTRTTAQGASEYHMFFVGIDSSFVPSIGHAVSTDRAQWTLDRDSLVAYAQGPFAAWDGSRFLIWVSSVFPPTALYRMVAIEETGAQRRLRVTQVLESLRPAQNWEMGGLSSPTVLEHSGQYHLWYMGWNAGRTAAAIGYARSGDGVSWTRCGNNPVLRPTGTTWEALRLADPEALVLGDRVRVYYAARGANGVNAPGYAFPIPNCASWDCFRP